MIKIKLNYILSAIVVVLLILCTASIYGPVHFNNEKAHRETVVKERLYAIRKAELKYRQLHGSYTADFKQLTDSKLLKEEMQYIPFSDKKKFELATTIYTGKSGGTTPLMECRAPYAAYLDGLSEKRINEITETANSTGEYPGLKIGDITTPNDNAGNWE